MPISRNPPESPISKGITTDARVIRQVAGFWGKADACENRSVPRRAGTYPAACLLARSEQILTHIPFLCYALANEEKYGTRLAV